MDGAYIDLGPVIRAVETVNRNLGIVERNLNSNITVVNNNVAIVNDNLNKTAKDLLKLKAEVEQMRKEQRLAAALQRALTEVIRVRQELEQNFGAHKTVREHMLGILQAVDLALISESTISKCTEELMISAPNYWLAPCLIALAAWISNNQSLAQRAIAEGVKRDKEKACLLFALITRRVNVGRIKAGKQGTNICFEWLNKYFETQDPRKMKSSIIAYIDAYTNGVFGNDKDNICGDHINHWMSVLEKEDKNFAKNQTERWVRNFESASALTPANYPTLKQICPDYAEINAYVSRIQAAEHKDSSKGIRAKFSKILNTPIDPAKLIKDIDDQLVKLVERYEDGREAELRDEDTYLSFVKEFNGDENLAKVKMDLIRAGRRDEPVNFAERLSESIWDERAALSARRTAFFFLRDYIEKAYARFITERKEAYPKTVGLNIAEKGNNRKGFTWSGSTENGENREELVASLTEKYNAEKKAARDAVSDADALAQQKKGKTQMIIGGIAAAVGVVFFFIPQMFVPGLIIAAAGTFFGIVKGSKKAKAGKAAIEINANKRKSIEKYYDAQLKANIGVLDTALAERAEANACVQKFLSDKANETLNVKEAK